MFGLVLPTHSIAVVKITRMTAHGEIDSTADLADWGRSYFSSLIQMNKNWRENQPTYCVYVRVLVALPWPSKKRIERFLEQTASVKNIPIQYKAKHTT